MDQIRICGGKKLNGKVKISGAKNAALPILTASLLAHWECSFSNIPNVRDVTTVLHLLSDLGAKVDLLENNSVKLDSSHVCGYEAAYDLVRTMRASILVLGPLLARFGRARVSLPGGCAIGLRPVNLHLNGLRKLGAKIELHNGYIDARADKLKGCNILLETPTVTGTENLMMAACLAQGETIIKNTACEPEILDLACVLNKMGAKIQGAGTDCIRIQGVDGLSGAKYSIMPDRVEAGTFMVAAAVTGSQIQIDDCCPEHLTTVMDKLREAGVEFEEKNDKITVSAEKDLRAIDIKTAPYPSFPTDMQAQFMSLMSLAQGTSMVIETVFENRFMHVLELIRMGADIKIEGHTAMIKGVSRLSGAPVMATDLRASASLVLAGLAAEGETLISRIYHLDRGYESIEQKLASLGAEIKRLK